MKGVYFVNTDIHNTRAHTAQALHTAAAMNGRLALTFVAPRYAPLEEGALMDRQGLKNLPPLILLWNFGLRRGGVLPFVLFNLPASLYLIGRKMRGEVDFVYVRSTFFLPLLLVARILHIPSFFETHRKAMSSMEKRRDVYTARLCAGIVVASDYVRQYYERWGKPLLVAHDAVSFDRFSVALSRSEARKRLGLPTEGAVCVYTGTVSALKGIPTLLAAARLLPAVTFILVGRITDVKEKDAPDNVLFLGPRPQAQLPEYLRAADLALIPHPLNEYSQSPMKLFEYMAAGTPIVASRLPALTEVLNDTNAVLVSPDDPEALAGGIHSALENPEKIRSLAEQAKQDVAHYSWEERGARIVNFIEETLRTRQLL